MTCANSGASFCAPTSPQETRQSRRTACLTMSNAPRFICTAVQKNDSRDFARRQQHFTSRRPSPTRCSWWPAAAAVTEPACSSSTTGWIWRRVLPKMARSAGNRARHGNTAHLRRRWPRGDPGKRRQYRPGAPSAAGSSTSQNRLHRRRRRPKIHPRYRCRSDEVM